MKDLKAENAELKGQIKGLREYLQEKTVQHLKTHAALAALKKDARICALGFQDVNENNNVRVPHDAAMAANRILEATEESEDE